MCPQRHIFGDTFDTKLTFLSDSQTKRVLHQANVPPTMVAVVVRLKDRSGLCDDEDIGNDLMNLATQMTIPDESKHYFHVIVLFVPELKPFEHRSPLFLLKIFTRPHCGILSSFVCGEIVGTA